jgi:hypothetical protein
MDDASFGCDGQDQALLGTCQKDLLFGLHDVADRILID